VSFVGVAAFWAATPSFIARVVTTVLDVRAALHEGFVQCCSKIVVYAPPVVDRLPRHISRFERVRVGCAGGEFTEKDWCAGCPPFGA
jgi:hypothetical protein